MEYVLDLQEGYGSDLPGETFRVLTKSLPFVEKKKELIVYRVFRTRRLVLEKWDGPTSNEAL